ncbi:hypothetical protein GEMRC1_000496 [Eukaryota sp. GEM-RC1]
MGFRQTGISYSVVESASELLAELNTKEVFRTKMRDLESQATALRYNWRMMPSRNPSSQWWYNQPLMQERLDMLNQ